MRLENKVAVVTGSSRGIGRAIALAFAREGAAVTVNYRSHPDEAQEVVGRIEGSGGRALALRADVSDPEDVEGLVGGAVEQFGRLDVMVNNAGIERKMPFLETPLGVWKEVMAINLTGAWIGCQEAAKSMASRGEGGRIINVSSVHEDRPMPTNSPYCAAKGGLRMLMRTIAVELAPHNITVNNIAPGAIETPINENPQEHPEQMQELLSEIPLGRIGQPEEVAELAVYLASEEAAYVTGSTFTIDGGMMRKAGEPVALLFGVSQFTSTPWSFERDVEEYARLGVDAIEVCEDKLDGDRVGEQLELVGERGLEISSVQPSVRTLFPSRTQPKPQDVPERLASFRRAIERVVPFAPGAPFVCNTGPPPKGNVREVLEVAAREYRALAEFAEERGGRVALEPLSPALMNVESAIWTLEQAMRVVAAVDRDNFGICVDVWNVWQNPGVGEQILACGDRVMVVHVSDWRTPRSYADRHVVGRGETPLPALLRAVHGSGYRGTYTLEIFSEGVPDSLWEADLSAVIAESRAGLEKAWGEAGLP